jgi:hypothetical protein
MANKSFEAYMALYDLQIWVRVKKSE